MLTVLHQLGADLGDPIEIARSGSRVVVSGSGLSAIRQDEIRSALDVVPRAETRFTGTPGLSVPARLRPSGAVQNQPVQTELESKLGGRAAFSRLADQLLQSSERLLARAHALQRLADRFSPAEESQLNSEDRGRLTALRRAHLAALRAEAQAISGALEPVLPRRAAPPAQPPATPWQPAVRRLLASARDCDRRLGMLLAGSAGDEPESLLRLAQALAELASNVQD